LGEEPSCLVHCNGNEKESQWSEGTNIKHRKGDAPKTLKGGHQKKKRWFRQVLLKQRVMLEKKKRARKKKPGWGLRR